MSSFLDDAFLNRSSVGGSFAESSGLVKLYEHQKKISIRDSEGEWQINSRINGLKRVSYLFYKDPYSDLSIPFLPFSLISSLVIPC